MNRCCDAYGTIDELNSFLGLLKDYIKDDKIKDILNKIQIKLFSIGSILASGKNKNISEKVKIENFNKGTLQKSCVLTVPPLHRDVGHKFFANPSTDVSLI